MRNLSFIICWLGWSISLYAQQKDTIIQAIDPLTTEQLQEIILIASSSDGNIKEVVKALGSLDSYLNESGSINMVKRGAYAWEPMLNGMATERSIITVDGMRIYAACTDKMDPVTSYVENSNLSRAEVSDGQSGAQHGGTIAGSIDLVRRKTGFTPSSQFSGSVFSGFETNNQQQIYGSSLNYSAEKLFTDFDFTYRDAKNYKAGHRSGQRSEVDFSQFTKYNLSTIIGLKLTERQQLEASVIFDKATDVGYPGLPMDVSLAQALIGSLEHRFQNPGEYIDLWETKAYFNTITHVMDDSHRPIVPVRMDMPGWSKTQGVYSKIQGRYNKHRFKASLSAHRNNSLAEMTMYPNDPNEADMFMLTWPDVNTEYAGLDLENRVQLNDHLSWTVSAGLGVHHNKIRSKEGLNSLRIFYPDLEPKKLRVLKNISTSIKLHRNRFVHQLGVGYGERAPSVSEGYGFYLLNTNDNYDYVGNPYLKNEKSLDINWSSGYESRQFALKASLHYFHIMDYILGKPREGIPSMNITADGIKVYEQLAHAQLLNSGLEGNYYFGEDWTASAALSYRYGQGSDGTRLPLIQPFTYKTKLRYAKNDFFGEVSVEGSSKNRNSIEYGEIQKPGFLIANIALSQNFKLKKTEFVVKTGVENIFDRYYSTFDDWFGIPSMGRNIYANLIFKW